MGSSFMERGCTANGVGGDANAITAAHAASCVWYRRSLNEECAEACIPPSVGVCPRRLVVRLGRLTAGRCSEAGFKVADGTMISRAGPCGTILFDKFKGAPLHA